MVPLKHMSFWGIYSIHPHIGKEKALISEVLVHCASGISRSSTLCMAHLMLSEVAAFVWHRSSSFRCDIFESPAFSQYFFLIFLVADHPHLGDPWIVRWPRSGASTLQLGWFAWPDPLRDQVWDPRLGNLGKDINNQYATIYDILDFDSKWKLRWY
jgi:hypothetical protein